MSVPSVGNTPHKPSLETTPAPPKSIGGEIKSKIWQVCRFLFGGIRSKPTFKEPMTSISSLTITKNPKSEAPTISPQMRSPDAKTTKANVNNAGKVQTSKNEMPVGLQENAKEFAAFNMKLFNQFRPATMNAEIPPKDLERLETLGKELKNECEAFKKKGIGVGLDLHERVISTGLENIAAAKAKANPNVNAGASAKVVPSMPAQRNVMPAEFLAKDVQSYMTKIDKFYSDTRGDKLVKKRGPELDALKNEGLALQAKFLEFSKQNVEVRTQLRIINEGLNSIEFYR